MSATREEHHQTPGSTTSTREDTTSHQGGTPATRDEHHQTPGSTTSTREDTTSHHRGPLHRWQPPGMNTTRHQGAPPAPGSTTSTREDTTSHQPPPRITPPMAATREEHHQTPGSTPATRTATALYNKVCNYIYLQINVNKSYIFV